MDWLDIITAALAIVVAPLALRNFLRGMQDERRPQNINRVNRADAARDNGECHCQSTQPQFPQKEEPPSERQPDSR